MPALPFFTFVAPTTSALSSTSQSGLASSNYAGFGGNSDLQTSELNSELPSQGLGFWQQLKTANESYALPIGQELAAFVGPLMKGETQFELPTEIETLSEDVLQSQFLQSGEIDSSQISVSIPAFQHIENLRNAQPQVHNSSLQTVQATAEQLASQMNKQGAFSQLVANSETQGLSTATESGSATKLQQTNLQWTQTNQAPLTVQDETVSHAPLTPRQGGIKFTESELATLNDDTVLEEFEMDLKALEGKSLHEKPMTLQTIKEAMQTSQVTPNNTDTVALNEGKLLSADGLQATIRDGQSQPKATTLDVNIQNSSQGAEKLPPHLQKIEVPPSHPQWNDQVAKRVMIMANESMQTARIQLDPPELGALEVKIKVQHDQVSVSFGSNHQVVRDALEAQSPRLRELLEQQGVNLADMDVTEHSNQQSEQQAQGEFEGEETAEEFASLDQAETQQRISIESDSLVDYFA